MFAQQETVFAGFDDNEPTGGQWLCKWVYIVCNQYSLSLQWERSVNLMKVVDQKQYDSSVEQLDSTGTH